MVVRDRGVRRVRALVYGLSAKARAWPAEGERSATSARPSLSLDQAAQLIGG